MPLSDLLPCSSVKEALGPGTGTKRHLFPTGWPPKQPRVFAEERKVRQGHGTCTCSSVKLETAKTGGLLKSTLELCGEVSLLPPGCKSLQAERTGCGRPSLCYPFLPGSDKQHPSRMPSRAQWYGNPAFLSVLMALSLKAGPYFAQAVGMARAPGQQTASAAPGSRLSKHSGAHSNFELNRAEHMATWCHLP